MASGATQQYAHAQDHAYRAEVDLFGGNLMMALLDPSYTPDLITDEFFADVLAHEVTIAGYTAGGVVVTSPAFTVTAANSWGLARASATDYLYGDVVRPAVDNGFLYRCAQAGTTGASPPAFPAVTSQDVTDGTVIWSCLGTAIGVFGSDPPTWGSLTGEIGFAVLYDATSGSPATEPLVSLTTFAEPGHPDAQPFDVEPDPTLGWFHHSPPPST